MGRSRRLILSGFLLAVVAAGQAHAHPHVFIDGGADLIFDEEGRLSALRITWIYDPLTSLFMTEDLGLPGTGQLTDQQRAELAAYQTEWHPEYDGDSYLLQGDTVHLLSGPRNSSAEIDKGQTVITFEREVLSPFRPEPEAWVEIYDPTYYTAYTITKTPEFIGNAEGCTAEIRTFEPTKDLAALQSSLFAIPADEDPEENLGRLFADKIRITCD